MNTYNRTDLSDSALRAWQEAHPELAPDRNKPVPEFRVNHDYDTPAQEAKNFREELRQQFTSLHKEIEELTERMIALNNNFHKAMSATPAAPPAPAIQTSETFTAVKIEREKRKGKYYYKMLGGQFSKHGITVWDEVLEAMSLDKVEYDEDDIHKLNPPILVRMSSEPYTTEDGETKTQRKVIGRA